MLLCICRNRTELPDCNAAAPSPAEGNTTTATPPAADDDSDFPIVAVVVPLAVGIPLALFLGAGYVVWRRKARRALEAEAALKRQQVRN